MKQPKKNIVWHNPENIDPSTIPEGWRFLVEGEEIINGDRRWGFKSNRNAGGWLNEPDTKRTEPVGTNITYIVGYALPDEYMEEATEWRPLEEWKEGPAWLYEHSTKKIRPAYDKFPHGDWTHFTPMEFPSLPVIKKTQEEKDKTAFVEWNNLAGSKKILADADMWHYSDVHKLEAWNAALAYARKSEDGK